MTEHTRVEVELTVGDAIAQANDELNAIWTAMMWAAQEDEVTAEPAAHAAAMLIEAGEVNLNRSALVEGFMKMTTGPVELNSIWRVTGVATPAKLPPAERLSDARAMMQAALDVIEENMAMAAQDDWFAGRRAQEEQFVTLMRMCDQLTHTIARTAGLTFPDVDLD
jgi:hypothetical protein